MAELVQFTNNNHNFLDNVENMLRVFVLLSDVCRVIAYHAESDVIQLIF